MPEHGFHTLARAHYHPGASQHILQLRIRQLLSYSPALTSSHPRSYCSTRLWQDGWTSLMLAANQGHKSVAQLLIVHKARVNAMDKVP
jgi:hypothetical protein